MNEEIVSKPIETPKINKKKIVILISILLTLILLMLYSRFISTSGLVVKEYKVVNSNITDNFYGLKIVHLTDVHYGRTINKKELNNLIKEINLLKPDIVVLTGDLIDRNTKLKSQDEENLISALKNINASLGKYAIMGNHDYPFESWDNIIDDGGFINLDDNYDLIYKNNNTPILITGISTNIMINTSLDKKMENVNEYLSEVKENIPLYRILLIHEPDYISGIDLSKYNLVLAGHSHNGQVRLPFFGAVILPEGAKRYYQNYYKVNNTDMYISSGVGTSIISYRFLNKPSISLYRLTNK